MAYWKYPKKGEYPEEDRLILVIHKWGTGKILPVEIGAVDPYIDRSFWYDNVRCWTYLPKIWKN